MTQTSSSSAMPMPVVQHVGYLLFPKPSRDEAASSSITLKG